MLKYEIYIYKLRRKAFSHASTYIIDLLKYRNSWVFALMPPKTLNLPARMEALSAAGATEPFSPALKLLGTAGSSPVEALLTASCACSFGWATDGVPGSCKNPGPAASPEASTVNVVVCVPALAGSTAFKKQNPVMAELDQETVTPKSSWSIFTPSPTHLPDKKMINHD
jgi:hypothetical protein